MAGRAPIKIRIGASIDASVDRAFDHIEKRAQKAQDRVRQSTERANRAAEKAAERAARAQVREQERVASAEERSNRQRERAAERLATAKERAAARAALRQEREAIRAARTEEREAQRVARAAERAHEAFARRTSHRATRFLMPNAPIGSMAMRGLGQATRGMGIDVSIASNMARITEQEKRATTISNKAAGAQGGERVAPGELVAEMRNLSKQMGGSTSAGMEAMEAFVNQRGNLSGFREIAPQLMKRVISQGGDPADIGLTAAKIDSALASQGDFAKDDQLRNRTVMQVLDNLIQQGKVGSIDFDSMAKEIPKLSGIAAGIAGDAPENISKLMTIAQLAERGPAKNSATASTFAQNFALDLPKRSQAFRDVAGIEMFSKDGKVRDLEDIIVETLAATDGRRTMTAGRRKGQTLTQTEQLQELLPNKRSFLALQEFLNVFQGAGGGEAGVQAVRAEFQKFGGSASAQLDADFAAQLNTGANRAERFNASLEETMQSVRDKLIPALDAHAGTILRFAEVIGNVATWALDNPKSAIAAAISASIARAGLESALRAGIETLIGAAGGGAGGVGGYTRSAGFMGGVGLAGNLAAGMTIASLAVTSVVIGRAIIDHLFDNSEKKDDLAMKQALDSLNLTGAANNMARQGDIAGAIALQKQIVEGAKNEATYAKNKQEKGFFESTVDNMLSLPTWMNNAMGTPEAIAAKDAREQETVRLAEIAAQRQQEKLDKLIELQQQQLDAIRFGAGGIPGMDPGLE